MAGRSSILEHVIDPKRGDLSAELARYILTLNFPKTDHIRYAELAEKAQLGALSESERAELEDFLNVNDFLAIIQAKARASMKNQNSSGQNEGCSS
ncbi:MAG TPA: hypothetical protein VFW23_01070 [Tepidisphaeraceae bacterium]|nr:hypothetical protein [Tepidisphaeraceae bacterium]